MFGVSRRLGRRLAVPTLNLAYNAGIYRVLSAIYGGSGVIFSLHRVVEPGQSALNPVYKIRSDILDDILGAVRRLGWEIVSIDDVYRRLLAVADAVRDRSVDKRRFACFTFDDGYVDSLTLALPIFRRHEAPLCLFVASGLVERRINYWWGANEELILESDRIDLPAIGSFGPRVLWARTAAEKAAAYQTLDGLCHKSGDALFPVLRQLYEQYGVDPERSLDRDALTVAQVRKLACDPLVTIGSHSVTHQRLSLMDEEAVRFEMEQGRRTLEDWSGRKVRHFAYPFGRSDACGPREFAIAKQSGFATAVTTRQGNIFPGHSDYLESLPRRSIPLSRFALRNVLFGVQTILHNDLRFQAG
jgi:peptidoglycan/xylan/chitin deacetylase (PgdA/CDA1 family)